MKTTIYSKIGAMAFVLTAILSGCAITETDTVSTSAEKKSDSYPIMIMDATALFEDGHAENRRICISNGKIVAEKECGDHPYTKVIKAPGYILTPGFINAHDHLDYNHMGALDVLLCDQGESGDKKSRQRYDQRHDWRKGCRGFSQLLAPKDADPRTVAFNELRQLISGTTIIVSSDGAPGFVRNLGSKDDTLREGLVSTKVIADVFPLGDAGGCPYQQAGTDNYPSHPNKNDLKDVIYVAHVAEGVDSTARNEFLNLSSDNGKRINILGSNVGFVHLMSVLPQDIEQFAKSGATLVWSPRSNISLYGDTALVTLFKKHKVNIALSTDWAYSGSINLLDELSFVVELNNRLPENVRFNAREIWDMVTINPAKLLQIDKQLGSIREGKLADLVLIKKSGKYPNSPHADVINAKLEQVEMVMRGGNVLYASEMAKNAMRDGVELIEVKLPNGSALSRYIDVKNETTDKRYSGPLTYSQLNFKVPLAGNGKKPCGIPVRGKTIDPAKAKYADVLPVYPRTDPAFNDSDKDGISADGKWSPVKDNNNEIFNPLRPVDVTDNGNVQVVVW